MQWQQIVGFYYVGKLGNLSRAAEVTNRTPSAVSHQVKFLEQQLGCELLQRESTKGLSLTPEGRELFKYAQKALHDHDNLIRKIESIKNAHQLKLTVSAPVDTFMHLLPPYVAKFQHRYRNVELTLLERTVGDIVDGIRAEEIDIGIAIGSAIPPDLTTLEWKQLRYYLVLPAGHKLETTEKISLQQIASCPLILPASTITSWPRTVLIDGLHEKGLSFRIAMEVSNVALSFEYCSMNCGVYFALCSDEMIANMPDNLVRKPLRHLFPDEHIGIFYQESRSFSDADRWFLDILFDR